MATFKKTLNALGGVFDNGNRVYSASNPPPGGGGGGAALDVANIWTAKQTYRAAVAAGLPVAFQGAAGQTADLAEFLDDTEVVLSRFNAAGQLHEGNRRVTPLTSRLSSQASTTNTTYSATGMSVSVLANTVYRVTARGSYQTAVTTTGIGFQMGGSATVSGARIQVKVYGITAVGVNVFVQTALSPNSAKSSGVLAANTPYPFEVDGILRVANAGTIELQFASETTSTAAVVHADSFLRLEEMA